MIAWPKKELSAIAAADDLHIAPFREDGITYGTPTWIWSVAVDGELYVRAYNGPSGRWYQAAARQRAGRIIAAGMTREVIFEPVAFETVAPDTVKGSDLQDCIDGAYRAKYHSSSYLKPMIGARARAATVRIVPHKN